MGRRSTISEKAFMSQVVQLARMMGWAVYHAHDSRRSVAGFPDLILLRGDRCIVAELKVGGKQPSAEQIEWLDRFRRAGIAAYVWRDDVASFDELRAALAGENVPLRPLDVVGLSRSPEPMTEA